MGQLILDNLWAVCAALASLVATVVTIRVTMKSIIIDLAELKGIQMDHGVRISSLEVAQAERLGYERGVAEANRGNAA